MQLVAPALIDDGVDAFLAKASFFSRFSDDQRARILAISQPVNLPPGTQVYSGGDAARTFYILLEGTILFSLAVGSRQANAGQIIGNGEVFGWGALVESGKKRIANAVAISPCYALAINGDELIALADADHSLGYALMRTLNTIITGTLTAFAAG